VVVAANPQVHVLLVDVDAVDGQRLNYLRAGDPACRMHVNQLEGIMKVEIRMPSQPHFKVFQFPFSFDDLTQRAHQFFLFVERYLSTSFHAGHGLRDFPFSQLFQRALSCR